MTQFLLEIDVNAPIENLNDILSYGGKMMVVGLGIVFAVLSLLCIFLIIFKSICNKMLNSSSETSRVAAPAQPEIIPQKTSSEANENEEIVAVIAAAIAAASAEFPDKKFRVVSFKRL